MDQQAVDQAMSLVTTYGLSVIGGIVILIIGWVVAKWASASVRKVLLRSSRVDETLASFFASLVKYVILVFVVIAVLNQFGVQTASLIAIFGAAGLAIGLALQGTLSNVAAGVMLLIFRPYKLGQYVEVGGHAGSVVDLNLFTTELATPDNVQIIIPNGAIWGSSVVNYSHHATRRVDFVLGIAYSDDIELAVKTVQEVIDGDERALKDPEAQVVVGELADSSVNLTIRVWVKAADYWPLKFDFTRRFKEACDAKGLSIPFPQQDVHMHNAA